MSSFSCVQDLLARRLWAVGAVKDKMHPDAVQRPSGERGFLLKLHEKDPDAPLSPVYFNLRTPGNPKPGLLVPAIVEIAGRALYAHCYQGGASVAATALQFGMVSSVMQGKQGVTMSVGNMGGVAVSEVRQIL